MKKNLVIIIIFLVFIYCPTIIYKFVEDKLDHNNYENRELYKKPDFTLNNITNFPKSYENYFNDNLPFKNEIRKLRSYITYNFFATTSNSRVIQGKDGWLFYNSAVATDGNSIGDYRKTAVFTEAEQEKIAKALIKTDLELKKDNIDFYIWIIPNKEQVYYDYMPKIINRNSTQTNSRTENLIKYLEKNSDLNIIYPKNVLITERNQRDTYLKYDTHWNDYGAYVATIDLIKTIDPNFDLDNQIEWSEIAASGDLANMLMLGNSLRSVNFKADNFLNDITYNCQTETAFHECTSNGLYNETILLIGDSFRTATIQYLAKIFNKAIFIHNDYYNENLIDKYKADIVIYEVVERYSAKLQNSSEILNE